MFRDICVQYIKCNHINKEREIIQKQDTPLYITDEKIRDIVEIKKEGLGGVLVPNNRGVQKATKQVEIIGTKSDFGVIYKKLRDDQCVSK